MGLDSVRKTIGSFSRWAVLCLENENRHTLHADAVLGVKSPTVFAIVLIAI